MCIATMESAADNTLGQQVKELYQCVELTEKDYLTRYEIRDDASKAVRNIFPKAEVHIVGSVASKMASLNSDLDLLVNTSACESSLSEKEKVISIVENLKANPTIFGDVKVMSSNNVCLIMMRHLGYDVPVTMRLDHLENLRIALFMKALAELHPTLRMFCVVVREWALARELIRRKGALTGYTLALLVVFYFEQIGEISVDTIKILSKSSKKEELRSLIQNWQVRSEANTAKLGDIFNGFMQYFGKFGLFESAMISLLDGRTMKRPREMKSFKVCIMDPVTGTNAGRCYSRMSDPEEPFVKTAANLRKDYNLYTACFRRSNNAAKKRKNPLFDLPVFRNMSGMNFSTRGKWTSLGQRRQVFDAVNQLVRSVQQNNPDEKVGLIPNDADTQRRPNNVSVAKATVTSVGFAVQQHDWPTAAPRTRSYPGDFARKPVGKSQSRVGAWTGGVQPRLLAVKEKGSHAQPQQPNKHNSKDNKKIQQRPSSAPRKLTSNSSAQLPSKPPTLAEIVKQKTANVDIKNAAKKKIGSRSTSENKTSDDVPLNSRNASENRKVASKKTANDEQAVNSKRSVGENKKYVPKSAVAVKNEVKVNNVVSVKAKETAHVKAKDTVGIKAKEAVKAKAKEPVSAKVTVSVKAKDTDNDTVVEEKEVVAKSTGNSKKRNKTKKSDDAKKKVNGENTCNVSHVTTELTNDKTVGDESEVKEETSNSAPKEEAVVEAAASTIMNDITNRRPPTDATSPGWTPVIKRRSRASRVSTSRKVEADSDVVESQSAPPPPPVKENTDKRKSQLLSKRASSAGSSLSVVRDEAEEEHVSQKTVVFEENSATSVDAMVSGGGDVATSPVWMEVKKRKSRSSHASHKVEQPLL